VFRQIGHDERVHKEESLAQMKGAGSSRTASGFPWPALAEMPLQLKVSPSRPVFSRPTAGRQQAWVGTIAYSCGRPMTWRY